MLNATLHSHLNDHNSQIAKDVKNDLYVDKFISGRDTEEETLQYYNEARSIMTEGNFNLRSWASNSKVLHTQATSDNVADKNEVVNLLGLKWTPSTDTLSLNPKLTSPPPESTYTKREVLRQASKTYDPLGLISPVTIKAKIFMQELSKSRVAPLKQLTLPQLELKAALTAARLASFVRQALEQRYSTLEIYMWSDSEIVLHWLNSDKTLKQFVANRVQKIKQLVPATHWNYCPTKSNPADLLTRGINSKQLKSETSGKMAKNGCFVNHVAHLGTRQMFSILTTSTLSTKK